MQEQPHFNPTLVRLKRVCIGERSGVSGDFNPTLVRLKLYLHILHVHLPDISILP